VHSFLPTLIAQTEAVNTPDSALAYHLVAAFIFSVFGVLTLALCVWIMGRLSPFSLVKEIEEDHNTAAAIVMGAVLIGMSLIIAAAIVG
jgi:putative membrane protein